VRSASQWKPSDRISGSKQDQLKKAETLLEALRNKKVTPDYVFETIESWVNPGGADAHEGAFKDAIFVFQELLREVNLMQEAKAIHRIGVTYSYLMHALLKTENENYFDDRLLVASKLRAGMEHLILNSGREIRLSAATLSANLLFLCRTGKIEESRSILSSMIRREDQGDLEMAPDLVCFNTMINGFASIGAVAEAKELIQLMISRKEKGRSNVVPDIISLHGVLQAYAKSNISDAAEQAEEFLDGISNLAFLVPDTLCFTTLINIYSKSRIHGSAKKAQRVLEKMLLLEEYGHDVHVDVVSFTAVIDAWAKSDDTHSLQKAEKLIYIMEALATNGNNRVAPNVATYNALINVIAKSKNVDAGHQALAVLRRMQDRNDVEPNEITFNSVISALVHSGLDESDTAMNLLSQMKISHSCKPTTITYNAVLHVLSRTNRGDAPEIAQMLLRELRNDSYALPSTITYNSIMQIFAKSSMPDAAEQIEGILNDLQANKNLQPNKQSYTTTISAWARSHSQEKVRRAVAIFERLKLEYASGNQTCRPDIMVYNALLNCCCFAIWGHDEASRVVIETFFGLQESGSARPDSRTFAFTLKALGRNMDPSAARDKLLKQVFDFACKDGLVDDAVLKELLRASNHIFQEVVTKHGRDGRRYPKQWSRCVK